MAPRAARDRLAPAPALVARAAMLLAACACTCTCAAAAATQVATERHALTHAAVDALEADTMNLLADLLAPPGASLAAAGAESDGADDAALEARVTALSSAMDAELAQLESRIAAGRHQLHAQGAARHAHRAAHHHHRAGTAHELPAALLEVSRVAGDAALALGSSSAAAAAAAAKTAAAAAGDGLALPQPGLLQLADDAAAAAIVASAAAAARSTTNGGVPGSHVAADAVMAALAASAGSRLAAAAAAPIVPPPPPPPPPPHLGGAPQPAVLLETGGSAPPLPPTSDADRVAGILLDLPAQPPLRLPGAPAAARAPVPSLRQRGGGGGGGGGSGVDALPDDADLRLAFPVAPATPRLPRFAEADGGEGESESEGDGEGEGEGEVRDENEAEASMAAPRFVGGAAGQRPTPTPKVSPAPSSGATGLSGSGGAGGNSWMMPPPVGGSMAVPLVDPWLTAGGVPFGGMPAVYPATAVPAGVPLRGGNPYAYALPFGVPMAYPPRVGMLPTLPSPLQAALDGGSLWGRSLASAAAAAAAGYALPPGTAVSLSPLLPALQLPSPASAAAAAALLQQQQLLHDEGGSSMPALALAALAGAALHGGSGAPVVVPGNGGGGHSDVAAIQLGLQLAQLAAGAAGGAKSGAGGGAGVEAPQVPALTREDVGATVAAAVARALPAAVSAAVAAAAPRGTTPPLRDGTLLAPLAVASGAEGVPTGALLLHGATPIGVPRGDGAALPPLSIPVTGAPGSGPIPPLPLSLAALPPATRDAMTRLPVPPPLPAYVYPTSSGGSVAAWDGVGHHTAPPQQAQQHRMEDLLQRILAKLSAPTGVAHFVRRAAPAPAAAVPAAAAPAAAAPASSEPPSPAAAGVSGDAPPPPAAEAPPAERFLETRGQLSPEAASDTLPLRVVDGAARSASRGAAGGRGPAGGRGVGGIDSPVQRVDAARLYGNRLADETRGAATAWGGVPATDRIVVATPYSGASQALPAQRAAGASADASAELPTAPVSQHTGVAYALPVERIVPNTDAAAIAAGPPPPGVGSSLQSRDGGYVHGAGRRISAPRFAAVPPALDGLAGRMSGAAQEAAAADSPFGGAAASSFAEVGSAERRVLRGSSHRSAAAAAAAAAPPLSSLSSPSSSGSIDDVVILRADAMDVLTGDARAGVVEVAPPPTVGSSGAVPPSIWTPVWRAAGSAWGRAKEHAGAAVTAARGVRWQHVKASVADAADTYVSAFATLASRVFSRSGDTQPAGAAAAAATAATAAATAVAPVAPASPVPSTTTAAVAGTAPPAGPTLATTVEASVTPSRTPSATADIAADALQLANINAAATRAADARRSIDDAGAQVSAAGKRVADSVATLSKKLESEAAAVKSAKKLRFVGGSDAQPAASPAAASPAPVDASAAPTAAAPAPAATAGGSVAAPSPDPSQPATPSVSGTASLTATVTPTTTPQSASTTPSPSETPSATPTVSLTSSVTPTVSPTATGTPSPTPSVTGTGTPTPSVTPIMPAVIDYPNKAIARTDRANSDVLKPAVAAAATAAEQAVSRARLVTAEADAVAQQDAAVIRSVAASKALETSDVAVTVDTGTITGGKALKLPQLALPSLGPPTPPKEAAGTDPVALAHVAAGDANEATAVKDAAAAAASADKAYPVTMTAADRRPQEVANLLADMKSFAGKRGRSSPATPAKSAPAAAAAAPAAAKVAAAATSSSSSSSSSAKAAVLLEVDSGAAAGTHSGGDDWRASDVAPRVTDVAMAGLGRAFVAAGNGADGASAEDVALAQLAAAGAAHRLARVAGGMASGVGSEAELRAASTLGSQHMASAFALSHVAALAGDTADLTAAADAFAGLSGGVAASVHAALDADVRHAAALHDAAAIEAGLGVALASGPAVANLYDSVWAIASLGRDACPLLASAAPPATVGGGAAGAAAAAAGATTASLQAARFAGGKGGSGAGAVSLSRLLAAGGLGADAFGALRAFSSRTKAAPPPAAAAAIPRFRAVRGGESGAPAGAVQDNPYKPSPLPSPKPKPRPETLREVSPAPIPFHLGAPHEEEGLNLADRSWWPGVAVPLKVRGATGALDTVGTPRLGADAVTAPMPVGVTTSSTAAAGSEGGEGGGAAATAAAGMPSGSAGRDTGKRGKAAQGGKQAVLAPAPAAAAGRGAAKGSGALRGGSGGRSGSGGSSGGSGGSGAPGAAALLEVGATTHRSSMSAASGHGGGNTAFPLGALVSMAKSVVSNVVAKVMGRVAGSAQPPPPPASLAAGVGPAWDGRPLPPPDAPHLDAASVAAGAGRVPDMTGGNADARFGALQLFADVDQVLPPGPAPAERALPPPAVPGGSNSGAPLPPPRPVIPFAVPARLGHKEAAAVALEADAGESPEADDGGGTRPDAAPVLAGRNWPDITFVQAPELEAHARGGDPFAE